MKTVYKFILKSYVGPMLLSLVIVMFVLLMQFMWRYIDELVGKGLTLSVIMELMAYASTTLIPMGLPLATLFAAIMTMGDLGENNELLALKCAGMSLPRIIRPLVIFIIFVAIGSFFVANNLVPYSTRKMAALLYDIRSQKQSLEFQDGIFYNGIDNLSIRVGKQHSGSGMLEDVLIYDTRNVNGDMMTTIADSGYIGLSEDKNFLMVTLFNGQAYQETRSANNWLDQNELRQNIFDQQDMMIDLQGFNMERTDESQFTSSSKSKNIRQLQRDIDSLKTEVGKLTGDLNSQFLQNSIFVYNKEMATDTLENIPKYMIDVTDSIAGLSEVKKGEVVANALRMANNARSYINFDESHAKTTLTQLYKAEIEWHRMLSLPISITIFFLIGAPLGAIIRKGGLGLPVVVSVIFFVIYYIISLTGEKMAGEGNWSALRGMWISTFILFPIAIFLTYKATNDSNLFNIDSYRNFFRRIVRFFQKSAKA